MAERTPPPPEELTPFDSTTALVRALASSLAGKPFYDLGMNRLLGPLTLGLNRVLPIEILRQVYQRGARHDARPPETLGDFRAESFREWATAIVPPGRRLPAVAIGAANGAAVFLCAALGIPWLPQNFLLLVRRAGLDPDDPVSILEAGREVAPPLLAANPDLALHHMVDPAQDRLMAREALYFRCKVTRLGPAYEQFLRRRLEPGGTILVIDGWMRWPVTRVADRHVFQFGGYGGLSPAEYLEGGPRVRSFLEREGSRHRAWRAPAPDERAPEAEWSLDPELTEEIARFAREEGYRVLRLSFERPEDPSPMVAELYRHWYRIRERRIRKERLTAACFFLVDPHRTIGTGAVPFWMAFNTAPSAEALESYLDRAATYDEIRLLLFAHGTESPGLVPFSRWEAITRRARRRGWVLGARKDRYPFDFASPFRFGRDLDRIRGRVPPPRPLTLEEFLRFPREGFPVRLSSRAPLRSYSSKAW